MMSSVAAIQEETPIAVPGQTLDSSRNIIAVYEFAGEKIPLEQLPKPVGYRILVGMIKIQRYSKGGIAFVEQTISEKEYLSTVGRVLAIGPSGYLHDKFLIDKKLVPWCKVGDIIEFKAYTGQSLTLEYNNEVMAMKFMNDDEVLGVIPDMSILFI